MKSTFCFLLGLGVGVGAMLPLFFCAIQCGIEHRGAAKAYRDERDAWMVQSLKNTGTAVPLVLTENPDEIWPEEIGEA